MSTSVVRGESQARTGSRLAVQRQTATFCAQGSKTVRLMDMSPVRGGRRFPVFTSLVVIGLASHAVHADQPSATFNIGGEALWGTGGSYSGGVRVHGGYGRSFGDGHIQPTVTIGATAALGAVRDPADPDRSLGLYELGPELSLALRFADGGWADKRVFVNAAALGPLGNGGTGFRLGAGVNWLDAIVDVMDDAQSQAYGDHRDAIMYAILPDQLELAWERSVESDRFGVVVAWGL